MDKINIQKLKIYDIYNKKHHTTNGFKNPFPPIERSNTRAFFWILDKIISGEEENKIFPAEMIPINKREIRNLDKNYLFWWIGHSTVLIQTPQYNIITDPQFSDRASPFSFAGPMRHAKIPIKIKELPKIDFVLISHNHYDHLDEASVKELENYFQPVFFVPLKVGKLLKQWGIKKIIELDWWEYVEIENLKVYCTPARHFSSRTLWDRNETLWSGWYIIDNHQFSFYFAGDTGYERFFQEIRENIGSPDVALIPIGAFLPRWMMQEVHVDPMEAFRAFLDLDAKHFIPIHWGTFYLAEEPMNLPPILLKETYEKWKEQHPEQKKQVYIPRIGEKLEIPYKKIIYK